jgi:hypothetical protein
MWSSGSWRAGSWGARRAAGCWAGGERAAAAGAGGAGAGCGAGPAQVAVPGVRGDACAVAGVVPGPAGGLRALVTAPVPSSTGSASSSPASGYRAPGANTGAAPSPSRPHLASARSACRGTGSGCTGSGSPAATPTAAPCPADGTRPSALRTLNVDTPVAAAISRSVAPAASSPAIRSTSSAVSFEAPFGPRRAGTSQATPSADSDCHRR